VTPTRAEVRAALGRCANVTAEVAASYDHTDAEGDKLERHAAVLRAMLETLDEREDFHEAAMEWGAWYDDNFKIKENWSQEEAIMLSRYRTLVAKQEAK
jgi:hypothetical protein